MAVSRPCYCNREDVKAAPDFAETSRGNTRIDRAIQSVSDVIDGEMKRFFYPLDATFKFDWPNWSYAPPWKLYLDRWDLQVLTSVTSGGVAIPLASVIPYPVNRTDGWPYTRIELDRSTSAVFAAGSTPQLSISLAGTWGFTVNTDPAGILAAAISTAGATTMTVSDASRLGVGDLAIIDTERLLVTEKATVTTGQTNVSGGTSASAADNAITVTSGVAINLGEVLLLDSERLLVDDVTGNVVTVRRAWDGTVLATHSGGTTLYAYRVLTVARGQCGTTATTHLISTAVSRHRPPGPIRDLGIAESVNRVLQETSGYARTVGEGDAARPAPGVALADLWAETGTLYRRKARIRAV